MEMLPAHLSLELSSDIHRSWFKKYTLFLDCGAQNFAAWIGARLKPQLFTPGSFFYTRNDVIDNFYFKIRGISAFVMPEQQNELFAVVDPDLFVKQNNAQFIEMQETFNILQYFGAEDYVINTTA